MEDESVGDDLHHRFHGEDDEKDILDVFLSNKRLVDQPIEQIINQSQLYGSRCPINPQPRPAQTTAAAIFRYVDDRYRDLPTASSQVWTSVVSQRRN